MSNLLLIYGLLSSVCAITGFIPYIRTILKGKTKPEKSSWWIWSLLMLIAFAAQVAQGARWSLLLTATFFIFNIIVAFLSLKHGYGHFKTKDLLAVVAAISGILLWIYTNNPLTALFITILVDFLGNWLTMTKSWRAPYTENLFTWFMLSVASAFSVLAVGAVSTQKAIFPVYSVLVNTACFILLLNRRRWRSSRIIAGMHRTKS